MVTRRSAKVKGSQFEYDCHASLKQRRSFDGISLTKERGFQRQFDIKIPIYNYPDRYLAVECKRHAKFSWNQLLKLYKKLVSKTPDADNHYLLFKPNLQPCLVFYFNEPDNRYEITPFPDFFGVPFIKHESTRPKKSVCL